MKDPKPIKDVLQKFLDTYPHKRRLRQGMVISVWPKIVGNKIADQTQDLHFEGNNLVCKVSNQVWRHEIHANRFQIAKRLNDEVKSQVVGQLIVRA